MDIRTAFPSTYLKAADLANQEFTLRIRSVALEDIGGDQKPILYFDKTDKGVVLNKTNASALENAYGHDTDAWAGKSVVLFPATTQFQGRTVDCIRLRPHYPKANGAPGQPTLGRKLGGVSDMAIARDEARDDGGDDMDDGRPPF